jgi:tetratricopeptide (TPR) repeat protein
VARCAPPGERFSILCLNAAPMGRGTRRKKNRPVEAAPPGPSLGLDALDHAKPRATLVSLLVIAAATVLVYSNSFDASFHFDDRNNIVQNASIRDLHNEWPPAGSRYVGYLSFSLNYHFGGLEVFGYHLVNLLIHLGNGLLVFWLTSLTLRTPALRRTEAGRLVHGFLPLVAGLLFAVHPLQTQAVTYIVQRFASLATFFYLFSLALYVEARLSLEAERPSKRRATWLYCLSFVAAVAAMRTKEISFTLPVVAVGYELLLFGRGKRIFLLLPLCATSLLIPAGLATGGQSFADALSDAGHVAAETQDITRGAYLLTQTRVVLKYLRLLLVPARQNLDPDVPLSQSLAEPAVLVAVAVLLTLLALAVFLLRRARRTNRAEGILVFSGVAWLFVTLSVESSVIPIRDVMFEHRMYLPSVGALVALGTVLLWVVDRLRWNFPPALQVAGVLVITAGPLSVAAYLRNLVWKDDVTLWSDVAVKSPGKARAHGNLGLAYLRRDMTSEAIGQFRAALEISPDYVDALSNLGNAYVKQGRPDEAVGVLRKALALAPSHRKAHAELGYAYKAKGQVDDAIREYRESIRVAELSGWAGDLAEAHNNLGIAYADKGQLQDAEREYREAMRLSPSLAEAHTNLGAILKKMGRAGEAVEEHRRALELKHVPEVIFNLALALEADGRKEEAIDRYVQFLDEAGRKYPDRAEKVRIHIAELRASLPSNVR